jgi:hypothetical protein
MNARDLSSVSLEELLRQYEFAARAHSDGTTGGDYKKANDAYDRIGKLRQEILTRGDAGRAGILHLLTINDDRVRIWASAHALEFAPKIAEPILQQLQQGEPGPLRLSAEYTLRAWRLGQLHFP